MSRIICVGNRLVEHDGAGPAVHDALVGRVPAEITLIDAGTPGLRLLNMLDGAGHVVLVDGVCGFGQPGEVLSLSQAEVAAQAGRGGGHAAGLPEVLRWVASICAAPPEVVLVGLEAPVTAAAVALAADRALELARGGVR